MYGTSKARSPSCYTSDPFVGLAGSSASRTGTNLVVSGELFSMVVDVPGVGSVHIEASKDQEETKTQRVS